MPIQRVPGSMIDMLINELSNVSISGATAGQVLRQNGLGTWLNAHLAVSDLGDVSLPSAPRDGDTLIWDAFAAKWIKGRPFTGVLAKRNSDLTISNGVEQAIPWEAEVYDTANVWPIGSGDRTVLPVVAGWAKVRLSAQVYWASSTTGMRVITIRKNGQYVYDGTLAYLATPNVSGSGWGQYGATAVLDVVPGDYFQLTVQQQSGAGLSLLANRSWFQMEYIG